MVHRSMGDDSRVADQVYIKRGRLVLEDFLFFSLYSFSCISKTSTTLKQLRYLSCSDFLNTNFEPCLDYDITFPLPISAASDPACYNFSHWKPPGVSERMWSVNINASISGEYQTLGGHSCRPSE